jgi:hypothetical protein
MHNLKILKNRLVKNYFPELDKIKIKIKYNKVENGYLEYGHFYRGHSAHDFYLDVDPILKDSPKSVIKAGLAHELAHITDEVNSPYFLNLIKRFLYRFSRRYRIYVERKTDMEVVLRGMGHKSLLFSKWADNQAKDIQKPINPESGLLTEELEELVLKS